ncbi:hypothetical protein FRC04_007718 [Tulasnella sp. 424]|nr:hypothetical protein FRC04_007718 [Tulasnella sp. 424]KAG8979148.1 hypothetical protein FRC05_009358 [Tulasnella sp. 425]
MFGDEQPRRRAVSFNNSFLIASLDSDDTDRRRSWSGRPKKTIKPSPVLAERLPSTAFIQREAEHLAPISVMKAKLEEAARAEIENEIIELDAVSDDRSETPPFEPTSPATSPGGTLRARFFATASKVFSPTKPNSGASGTGPWKEPQPWEVMKAIESKDVMFLMEVRDRAFHLLLRRSGDVTPLLHAMRIGQSHRDVAIVLIGAMSRYVNNLEDEDMDKPKTKAMLKALRTNLKLAIDNSLAVPHQSDLIASFLQTLVMSEGDRWLLSQIHQISLEMRGEGKPVEAAEEAVRKFATRELGKAKGLIAAVDDYIANATGDLLMMAAWSLASEKIGEGDPVPTYYFARDDRVYKAFTSRFRQYRAAIRKKCSNRLQWQMQMLEDTFEGRNEPLRKKVDLLREELDASA